MSDCCSAQLLAEAAPLDAALLFGTGFVISLGHCTGMCGPLLSAYAVAQRRDGDRWFGLLAGFVVYHAGRLFSYGLLGLGLGLLGGAARLAGDGRALQGSISLAAGLLMALLALGLLGWLPTEHWVQSGRLGRAIGSRLRGLLGRREPHARFLLGMGNGFLPCGPVYAVALGAIAAADAWRGALAMLLFGLGTVPLLIALGLGAGRVGPALQRRLGKLGAVLVLLIGAQLMLRGAAAWEWIPHLAFGEFVVW